MPGGGELHHPGQPNTEGKRLGSWTEAGIQARHRSLHTIFNLTSHNRNEGVRRCTLLTHYLDRTMPMHMPAHCLPQSTVPPTPCAPVRTACPPPTTRTHIRGTIPVQRAHPQLQTSLSSALMRLEQACHQSLSILSDAIAAEHTDAYTDNNGIIGWWMSSRSYSANMSAADAVNHVQRTAVEVNRCVSKLQACGYALSTISMTAHGEGIRRAENAEHSFLGGTFDFFSGGNWNDRASSMRTLNELYRAQSGIDNTLQQAQWIRQQMATAAPTRWMRC